jgi:hypothetical protein
VARGAPSAGKTASILRVPLRIDGLSIGPNGNLGLPMADFSRLPYSLNDGSTVNTDPKIPNLAEAAFNARLASSPMAFPKGLHLHWALPDALTTGHHRLGSAQFPAVPNRWLVRRFTSGGRLQKSWVVESDFLHPYDANDQPIVQPPAQGLAAWPDGKPITFPTIRRQLPNDSPGMASGAAFRYMGRCLLLEDWLKPGPNNGNDYLNGRDAQTKKYRFSLYPLTAIGYGEPAFAAYYPNCYSVFGFCDVELDASASYQYEVIGWFHEPDLDPLQSAELANLSSDAARYAALCQEFRWCPAKADTEKPFPDYTVCYGILTLTPNQVGLWQPPGAANFDLAIGNTGGEALSALLADKVATPPQPADKVVIEDQLEAMNLAPALAGIEIDYAAHFAQTRHGRGFRGLAGGSRWAVLPKRPQPASAADAIRDSMPQPALPDAGAHALDALNTAQEAYDMAQQEIAELRYQVFCDWHKFLSAYYSDAVDLRPFREQADDMGNFIKQQPLFLLNDKVGLAGTLSVASDRCQADGSTTAALDLSTNVLTPQAPANDTLAVQVLLRLKALIDTLIAGKLTDQFEVARRPAEHFWSPREPVMLVSGPVAVSTPRHREAGDLACAVLEMADAPGTSSFISAVDTLKPAAGDPAIQAQSTSPWHPIILEWSISVQPVGTGRHANPAINNTWDYDSTFISGKFPLQENEPDFSPPQDLSVLNRDTYEGRCVMTPTASTQLDRSLSKFLMKTTLDDCRDRAAGGEDGYLDRLIAWYQKKHNVTPPAKDAEKVIWVKAQQPFVDQDKKDEDGNPVLLPVADLPAWYADKPVAGPDRTVGNAWNAAQQAADPVYSAIRALSLLDGMNVLSQALGGFNAALLARERVLQIPIEDPIGTLVSSDLTRLVAQAVGPHHPVAPRASKVFSPIRSGELTVDLLRLIDTFGQTWDAPLEGARLVTSNGLVDPNNSDNITYLPPRFTSPTRLNFRWLAALSGAEGVDEVEMNSSPATTPICGWLLPNHFDSSLMVYDNTGRALGSIGAMAEWMPAPGSRDRIAAAEVPNPHLRRLVRRLVIDVGTPDRESTIRQDFLRSFLSTLDSAIESIEPASFAQHEALALLIGRPIAVVRARADLQLMGQPTVSEVVDDPTIAGGKAIQLKKARHWKAFADQSWDAFAFDWGNFYGCTYDAVMNESCGFMNASPLADYARTTRGFENVVVPIRLGEFKLLNDGLVGFWKETADGELDNVFHAPPALDDLDIASDVTFQEGRTTPCIRAYSAGVADNLSMTLQDDPLALTLLMDPRGVVHVTCGALPVSKLEIPSAYYADALKRMGVTFRVSPLLTDAEQLHAALPKEAGYVWSWVTKPNGSTWEDTDLIIDATEHAHFFKPPRIVEGWLKLTPKNNS